MSDGSGKAGTERDKTMIGRSIGWPIVVAPPNDLLGLAITEGIEDALSAHEATGLGAWAAGSASRLPALANAVPAYIEAVTIYAHADANGQDGARKLAKALDDYGTEVRIEGMAS
jgi:Toprim domain